MKAKFDKMFLGLLSGVLAPTFIFFGIYFVKYAGQYSLSQIIEQIKLLDLGAKIIALTVFLFISYFFVCIFGHFDEILGMRFDF